MSIAINPRRRLTDQMGNADLTRTSTGAFSVIHALQGHDRDGPLLPGEFIAAVTAVFILTLECSRLPASDALGMVRNLMADADGRRPEFKAITDYINKEVLSL